MIVLDTNALIFWLLGSDRLSPVLQDRLSREETAYCSVSLWEIDLKQRQGKLILPWTAREIARKLKDVRLTREVPADGELWLASSELSWDHRDPADRLITALALQLNCDLATTDGEIAKFYPRCVF